MDVTILVCVKVSRANGRVFDREPKALHRYRVKKPRIMCYFLSFDFYIFEYRLPEDRCLDEQICRKLCSSSIYQIYGVMIYRIDDLILLSDFIYF